MHFSKIKNPKIVYHFIMKSNRTFLNMLNSNQSDKMMIKTLHAYGLYTDPYTKKIYQILIKVTIDVFRIP